jgi:hypothetical protein
LIYLFVNENKINKKIIKKIMKRIIRLTESDLTRIVRRVIKEAEAGAASGPAAYGDYIIKETTNDLVQASKGSTVVPFTHSSYQGGVGNKITVNSDRFSWDSDTGQYKKIGPETIVYYQRCGAQANLLDLSPENPGGANPVYYSKVGGPIQNKLTQSCKAQGFKGQIQNPVAKSLK